MLTWAWQSHSIVCSCGMSGSGKPYRQDTKCSQGKRCVERSFPNGSVQNRQDHEVEQASERLPPISLMTYDPCVSSCFSICNTGEFIIGINSFQARLNSFQSGMNSFYVLVWNEFIPIISSPPLHVSYCLFEKTFCYNLKTLFCQE